MLRNCKICGVPVGPRFQFCAPCGTAHSADLRRARVRAAAGARPLEDDIICPICYRHFRFLRPEHARQHGYDNFAVFRELFGLRYVRSPSLQSVLNRNLRPCKPGRIFTAEHRANLSKSKLGRSNKKSPEARERMSESAARRCLTYKSSIFAGIRGEWVFSEKADAEVFVRSSYEKRLLRVLDAHPDVIAVEVEPFAIPYSYESRQRHYIPDFLVVFEGNIREVWEVKPQKFIADPMNQAKIAALNAYGCEHHMNGCIVTLEAIQKLEREMMVRYATAQEL